MPGEVLWRHNLHQCTRSDHAKDRKISEVPDDPCRNLSSTLFRTVVNFESLTVNCYLWSVRDVQFTKSQQQTSEKKSVFVVLLDLFFFFFASTKWNVGALV